jgi:hypothetical protein
VGPIAAAFVAGAVLLGGDARADATNHCSWTSAGSVLTVVPDAGWHLNTDYKWSLTVGGTTVPKSSFSTFSESSIVIPATPGTGTLKGGVCSNDGNSCASITPSVSISK